MELSQNRSGDVEACFRKAINSFHFYYNPNTEFLENEEQDPINSFCDCVNLQNHTLLKLLKTASSQRNEPYCFQNPASVCHNMSSALMCVKRIL